MDEELRGRVRSYGDTFDYRVDLAAGAMVAIGYPSKHSPPNRSELDNDAIGPRKALELRRSLNRLGMLCLRIDNEIRRALPADESGKPAIVGSLAVAAEVGRLVLLLREAQKTEALTGRAAFELDGDIDELEDRFLRLDDMDALMIAARSMIEVSVPYMNDLPELIRETLAKLESLLPTSD